MEQIGYLMFDIPESLFRPFYFVEADPKPHAVS
jgi:hypothetical protein